MFGEHGIPQQLDLSPTLLTSIIFSMVGLLLTDSLGMSDTMPEPESLLVTVSFELYCLTLLEKMVYPKTLTFLQEHYFGMHSNCTNTVDI